MKYLFILLLAPTLAFGHGKMTEEKEGSLANAYCALARGFASTLDFLPDALQTDAGVGAVKALSLCRTLTELYPGYME